MAKKGVNMLVITVSLLISGIRQVEVEVIQGNIASVCMNPVFAPQIKNSGHTSVVFSAHYSNKRDRGVNPSCFIKKENKRVRAIETVLDTSGKKEPRLVTTMQFWYVKLHLTETNIQKRQSK